MYHDPTDRLPCAPGPVKEPNSGEHPGSSCVEVLTNNTEIFQLNMETVQPSVHVE